MMPFAPFSADLAVAEDGQFSGEVSATGKLTSVVGNKAKFNEYRDIRDGIYGDVHLRYDSEKYFSDFTARDMGYDTQRYGLEAGKWGQFKFDLHYEEIPHNFTYDAKTLYSGAGTPNLTYPTHPPGTDVSTWNTFDYSSKRKNAGGGVKVDALRPFFFDAAASREVKKGIYPLGVAGTSPGGIAIELPTPVDYTTESVKLTGGYSRNPLYLAAGYYYSNFSNSNLNLNFRDPATANTAAATDTLTLPPDNRYYKLDLKGGLKLPANSKFDVNLATSSTRSDSSLLTSYVDNVAGGLTNISLSSPNFKGQIDTRNLALALTSKPVKFFDGKVFLKYDERENKSDQITTTDATQTPSVFTNELFDYRKVNYGVELGFRLPARFYLNTIYSHGQINRKRDDIPENRDDLYGAELAWKGLDFLAARIGYERLNRAADFQATADPASLEPFIRRFDAAARTRDTYKAALDFFPTDNLSASLSYRYKETAYSDTILGLRSDKRDEFAFDVSYQIGKWIRPFGAFEYDRVRTDQFQRQLPTGSTTGFDPSLPPTTTAFNWTAREKDEYYSYTLGADVFLVPDKLTLRLQHSYTESNGNVDYTYLLGPNPLPAGRTQENIDLPNWDEYKLRYYLVKLTYKAAKAFQLGVGYVYEKYLFSDVQYDGYQYVPATTGTNGAYLTGAYQDASYESHVVFMTLSYQF